MSKINKLFLILILGFLPASIFANGKTAQTKMQFLKISPSARAAALADAFTSIAGDANAIFYNPAGMAFCDGLNVMVNKNDWLADIGHFSAVISYKAGNWGTFSLNTISMDYGEFQRTVIDEHAWLGYESLGTFSIAEYAFGFGYAKNITNRFSLGGQVKYIYQNLGAVESWSNVGTSFERHIQGDYIDDIVAFDLGTYYDTGYNGIIIAMSMQNFANSPIPLTFRYGMSALLNKFFWNTLPEHVLRLNMDLIQTKDYSDGYQVGLEYGWLDKIFLRGGYKLNYSEENLNLGVGLKSVISGLQVSIDYAYTEFELLGYVNRFSLGIRY